MATHDDRSGRRWKVLLGILVVLAASEFVARGPLRAARAADFNDFLSPYIQSGAWMKGVDPYSSQNLVQLWPAQAQRPDFLAVDAANGSLVYRRGIPTAYPLSALVLIAPFALLPWQLVWPLWIAITVAAFSITVACVLRIARLESHTNLTYGFLALALALAPFHTGLAAGSIVTVAIAASAAGTWAAERQRDTLAAALIAVAVALKPQIGLPFLFYYVVRRRWRIPATSLGLVAILFTIAFARLTLNATPWWQNYLYDNRVLLGPGSLGDFSKANPMRFGLVNFQVAAYTILHHRDWANLVAMAVAGTAGLVWLFLINKRNSRQFDLLDLSTLTVLSLLPIYHRFYDAALLIFALAWSLTALRGRLNVIAKAVLALIIAVFLVPGGSALEQFQRSGHFGGLKNYWWWNEFVLPHESWSVLLLSLLLLSAMYLNSSVESGR